MTMEKRQKKTTMNNLQKSPLREAKIENLSG